jgi:hypothetical protein
MTICMSVDPTGRILKVMLPRLESVEDWGMVSFLTEKNN